MNALYRTIRVSVLFIVMCLHWVECCGRNHLYLIFPYAHLTVRSIALEDPWITLMIQIKHG